MGRKYVQFYKEVDGEIMPDVGSDSVFYPDGRWADWTIAEKVKEHAHRLRNIKTFVGWTLHSGPMNRPSDRQIGPYREL